MKNLFIPAFFASALQAVNISSMISALKDEECKTIETHGSCLADAREKVDGLTSCKYWRARDSCTDEIEYCHAEVEIDGETINDHCDKLMKKHGAEDLEFCDYFVKSYDCLGDFGHVEGVSACDFSTEYDSCTN